MHEKFRPWLPAIFCAVLSFITVLGNLIGLFVTGTAGTADVAFYGFLPMCFYFVGAYLLQLRHENRELRGQIKKLLPKPVATKHAA